MTYSLDAELAAAVPMLPGVEIADLATARTLTADLARMLPAADSSGVDIHEVRIPGLQGSPEITLRIYTPSEADDPLPAIYEMHSGGFVVGTLDLSHGRDVELCREVGAVVVSVDYRLAPEHPFPAALDDCYAGLLWVAANALELGIDASRIAVHGQSAGGGLAAGLTLLARDRGGPPLCFQYLTVPALDDRQSTTSMRRFTDTPMWNSSQAAISWDSYLGEGVPGTDGVSPYAAPARATDLTGLPPAYVNVMQFDPLRDEGIAYALALLAADTPVELHLFPGTFHSSVMVATAEVSRRELAEEVAVLRRALHG